MPNIILMSQKELFRYPIIQKLLAKELSEKEASQLIKLSIRQLLMIKEGLWKPRKQKREEHRVWRQRKIHYGEMEQFDGSYEYWLEDRGPYCCLLLSVDDATSSITHGRFGSDEGVFPVFAFWREYLIENGKPLSVYLDQFSTYKMTQQAAKDNHDLKTQFQRAMAELGIELITAYSPEAKGRVERAFGFLQDRLIKEMRLKNISTLEEANQFLNEDFIPWYNARYAIPPKAKVNLHQKLAKKEEHKLESIFTKQEERTIQNDFTISFNNYWYQLTDNQPATVCKRDRVVIEEDRQGRIKIRFKGKYLNFAPIKKRTRNKRNIPWVLAATVKAEAIPLVKMGHFNFPRQRTF